mgnify:CR=1 FL=1
MVNLVITKLVIIKILIIFLTVILLLAVGASFVNGPAGLLANLTGTDMHIWLYIVFLYYIIATLLPIDKIIGKVYPFMGATLLFMAFGVGTVILAKGLSGEIQMTELTFETFRNYHNNASEYMIFPTLFIVISCGAISGFHATQSPLMARCIKSERQGRRIFYGAMAAEGVIALIWAAIGMAFFHGPDALVATMAEHGNDAAWAVKTITDSTLGSVGGFIALLGVVACAITSGDTAFRSARLIIADMLHYDQKPILKRLVVSIPLFAIGIAIAFMEFDVIWRYFAWSNQALSVITLWMITSWLMRRGSRWSIIALIPAICMTYVCSSFFFVSGQFVGLGATTSAYVYGGAATAVIAGLMMYLIRKNIKNKVA